MCRGFLGEDLLIMGLKTRAVLSGLGRIVGCQRLSAEDQDRCRSHERCRSSCEVWCSRMKRRPWNWVSEAFSRQVQRIHRIFQHLSPDNQFIKKVRSNKCDPLEVFFTARMLSTKPFRISAMNSGYWLKFFV